MKKTLALTLLLLFLPILSLVPQSSIAQSGPTVLPDGNVAGEESAAALSLASQNLRADLEILCFSTKTGLTNPCARVASIFANVTEIKSTGAIPADLSPFDVFYLGYGEGDTLESLQTQFVDYIDGGGGFVVAQPNLAGTVDVYPPGFEMTVTDIAWPGFPSAPGPVEFTSAGAGHPILNGLTPEDPSGNFDTVPIDLIGPGWSVLVKSVAFPHVALATGSYGNGRIAFHSGNTGSRSVDPGSDAYVRQLIEWAAAGTAPAGPDMEITAIEVTQAVQDLNNSVELIAGKRTYVRVHVDSPLNINDVSANLSGQRGSTTLFPTLLPGNPGADILIRTNPVRGQINDSFWFELPGSWLGAGSLTLTARLDPASAKNDPNLVNNLRSVTVNLLPTPPLRLRLHNVSYTVGAATHIANNSHLSALESWLRSAYPISNLQVTRTTFTYPTSGLPNVDTLNSYLALGKLLRIIFTGEDGRYVYYGMVNDGGGFMRGKAAGIPGTIASGPTGSGRFAWDTDGSYGDWYGGHEIAHTRGRYHAEFCGAGGGVAYPYSSGRISPTTSGPTALYGFDIRNQTIYGPTWTDVMTYCSYQWISDYTYEGIRSYTVSVGQSSPNSARARQAEQVLVIGGLVDLDSNEITLQQVHFLPAGGFVQPPPEGDDWTLVQLDANDQTLAVLPFEPQIMTDDEETEGQPALIAISTEAEQGLAAFEIRYQGQVIEARKASPNAPIVAITAPKESQQLDNVPFTFEWQGSDDDGDTLTYDVMYSNNNETWEALSVGLVEPELTVDIDDLPGGTGYLRILASDGFNSGISETVPFFLPKHAPQVEITSPAEGALFSPAQLVVMAASAYDLEDGQLAGDDLTWSSSMDGPLGSGEMIDMVNLSTGKHEITVTATDSDNETGEDTVTIEVIKGGAEQEPLLVYLPVIMRP